MSQTARSLSSSARETKWTVSNGTMAGSVRLMNAASFTIGRSPDCEFVIVNDPKCSRRHAQVEWNNGACAVQSLNEDNPVIVNGKAVGRTHLSDGDTLTIGGTAIVFNTTSVPDESSIRHHQLSVVRPTPTPAYAAPYPQAPRRSSPRARKPQTQSKKLWFYLILGGFVAFLFMGKSTKKKEALKLRTEQQIKADIEAANKLQENALNDASRRFDRSVTSRQAQENFVRGFRDYRKGQFERSLSAFQTCLALEPTHVLCNRYVRLAQRRFEELIQYNIVLGRQYRDQNQFRACRSAFGNAMAMIKDVNSMSYREAKANYDACNALAEGRY